MTDIVERIRGLRYVHVPVASQLFEEAAGEIEKLRQRLRLADAALRSDSPTLTDAERDAVEAMQAVCEIGVMVEKSPVTAATLRGLLERMQ